MGDIKQIQEMSNLINKNLFNYLNQDNLSCKDVCDLLANDLLKYYQPKLHENSIVLSREELNTIQANFFDSGIKFGSKEMAEKIFNKLKNLHEEGKGKIMKNGEHIFQNLIVISKKFLDELSKQFDVEIKE